MLIGFFVAGLFVSTVLHFEDRMSEMNAHIRSLDSQVNSLRSEIFEKLEHPYIVTRLAIIEERNNQTYNDNDPNTYNHLLISGTVTNEGFSSAYNAG